MGIRQFLSSLLNTSRVHTGLALWAGEENHFRPSAQASSSDVVMIIAPNGILRYVSQNATRVYGRETDELVGCELAAFIHPEDRGLVVHEVRRFLNAGHPEELTTPIAFRFKSGTGEWLNMESTVNRHRGGLILHSRDVTERVRLQTALQHAAEHDRLTNLPNRALFTNRVRQALINRRNSGHDAAVLFIGLDDFSAVNDCLGHKAGDELLVQAARRLDEAVGKGNTAARLGGDEFAALIVADGSRDRTALEQHILGLVNRLRLTLSQPYTIAGTDVRITASIGVAFAEARFVADELLRNANLDMFRAKAAGKQHAEVYAPQAKAVGHRHAELHESQMQVEDASAAKAAGETIEHTLARLFVRLGPPPEPTALEYTPAGSGDGGARQ